MMVLLALAIVVQLSDFFRNAPIVRSHHSAVAVSAKILCREKTESCRMAEAAGTLASVMHSVGLRRVFDHQQIVLLRNRADCVQVSWLAVEVNRHDGASARRDGRFER